MNKYIKKILIILIIVIILFLTNFIRNCIIINRLSKLSCDSISKLTDEKMVIESVICLNEIFYSRCEYDIKKDSLYIMDESNKLIFKNLAFKIITTEGDNYKIKMNDYKKRRGSTSYSSYAYINKETGLIDKMNTGYTSIKYTIEK